MRYQSQPRPGLTSGGDAFGDERVDVFLQPRRLSLGELDAPRELPGGLKIPQVLGAVAKPGRPQVGKLEEDGHDDSP